MTMPPWVRKLQQSYLVQTVAIPAVLVGLPATIATLLAASHGDLSTLSWGTIETAFGIGGGLALSYVGAICQHSPRSNSFHDDGTPNKMVEKVAAETAEIPKARADQLTVQVIPK
jgi:hypothetical protein